MVLGQHSSRATRQDPRPQWPACRQPLDSVRPSTQPPPRDRLQPVGSKRSSRFCAFENPGTHFLVVQGVPRANGLKRLDEALFLIRRERCRLIQRLDHIPPRGKLPERLWNIAAVPVDDRHTRKLVRRDGSGQLPPAHLAITTRNSTKSKGCSQRCKPAQLPRVRLRRTAHDGGGEALLPPKPHGRRAGDHSCPTRVSGKRVPHVRLGACLLSSPIFFSRRWLPAFALNRCSRACPSYSGMCCRRRCRGSGGR